MQSKGLVKFFLYALILVCAYQFLLILPTNKVEKAADNYAKEVSAKLPEAQRYDAEKTARLSYLDSMSSETIFSIPLIKKFNYEELKRAQLAMGLDLKGGMSVLLQVDLKDFLSGMSNKSSDAQFNQALDNATSRLASEQKDYITLFAEEWAKVSGGRKMADIFSKNEALKTQIKSETADQETLRVIREKANATVGETFNRLKQRIDKTGVVQPNVSLDAKRDMILVELPGMDNPERARQLLQKAAKLEFWETYRVNDPGLVASFNMADAKIKALLSNDTSKTTIGQEMRDSTYYETDKLGNIDSTKIKTMRVPVRNAIADLGGPLLSKLQVNANGQLGLSVIATADKNKKDEIYVSDAEISDKSKKPGYLNREEIKQLFPQDLMFRWSQDPMMDPTTGLSTGKYELYALKKTGGKDSAPLDGDVVTDAFPQPDPTTGAVQVSLRMNNKGAKEWADLTTKAANNQNREIAIVLDDEVVSAPRVINPITGGESSITGSYTVDEAKDFANVLQVGKLPARTRIVQESLVGPSLGADNIAKSYTSMMLSLLLLCVFMVSYYARGGWVSVVALLANLFFIIGALASMGSVLTLPGIAGILLTLASAIDANVITYERIREEMRNGKPLLQAIPLGFKHSLSAILDSNVTTLLTAIVLTWFGLGPIKGFGVVLIVGILSSLFTSILLARLMTDWWTNKGNAISYSYPWSEKWMTNVNFDWMGKRKIAYTVSGILLLISIGSMLTRGFELGVDFKGGYSYNVQFEKEVNLEQLRTNLNDAFGGGTIVKAVNTQNTFNITTPYGINDQSENAAKNVMAKLHEGVNKYMGGSLVLGNFEKTDASGTHVTSSTQVGATVADDIRNSSFKAGFLGLLLIFLFLLLRFRRWQFSLGAVLALAHDVCITLGAFSLLHGLVPFSLEIDQAIIACILTVIGYSTNDTVIVYDRIREYLAQYVGMDKMEVFNKAINNTLSRTIITSGTVVGVALILFIFGGSGIRSFAFGMFLGVGFGTYSSIYIASALVVDLTKERSLSVAQAVKTVAAKVASVGKEKATAK
jgi:SecD/SecF fusion protein